MATWNNKEESGKMYVYCSKNAVSDVAASNYFGKAAAWVSGGTYLVNDRVTSSSIQYRNKTGVNTTTAPVADTTNWEFDLDNFQTYNTSKVYAISSKTNYNNEHYICGVAGSTGTFQPANWTKVIISNRDVPYKLQNTAINLINSDTRFISAETLDLTNNIAYHNIYNVLSNGIWNETLTAPTKYIRIFGQSNLKTIVSPQSGLLNNSYCFSDNINYLPFNNIGFNLKAQNCVFQSLANGSAYSITYTYFTFSFKNIFQSINIIAGNSINYIYIYHLVNCTFASSSIATTAEIYFTTTVIKNNYFKGSWIFGPVAGISGLSVIPIGSFDYNIFDGTIYIDGVSRTTLSAIQSALPNQNIYSFKGTATLNSDYTLPVGSPLIKTGSNGNNIGAEGVGYMQSNINGMFDSANGAVYRNVTKYGTTLVRAQISKLAQAGASNTITLESNASTIDNEYNSYRIYISTGTGSGQTKTITAYNGTSKIATVDSNWTIIPDATSIYEILDGEVVSTIGDLGSVQTIKKLIFQNTNFYDTTGFVLNQTVSKTDARLDKPAALTFDLKVGNLNDLSAISYRTFVQDDYLKVDSADKGCGDSNYNAQNVVSSVLSFRYFQVRLMLRK